MMSNFVKNVFRKNYENRKNFPKIFILLRKKVENSPNFRAIVYFLKPYGIKITINCLDLIDCQQTKIKKKINAEFH